ncbi:MAG: DUF4861 domain-containing protein, partial [Planctomycetes bacterium]|nr:DUF4861 domain-containing protein [Planctomycetota bacterium]
MTDELIEKAVESEKNKNLGNVVVYNTTSWDRTDEVVLFDKDLSLAGDIVKDVKGKVVPSQRLVSGELAIMPGEMPPFSSRRFTIHKGRARAIGTANADGMKIGNELVSLEIDPKTGAIKALHRKGIDVNLVNSASKQGINDYLYIRGMNASAGRHRIKGPVKVTV